MTSTWTKERMETIRTRWAEGLSAQQIASEIGHVTRNAVIGKLHRMGLTGASTESRRTAQFFNRERKPKPKRERQKKPPTRMNRVEALHNLPTEPVPALPFASNPTVSMADAESCHCRWPCGEFVDAATPYFCGAQKIDGLSYCETHARIAYRVCDPVAKKDIWPSRAPALGVVAINNAAEFIDA